MSWGEAGSVIHTNEEQYQVTCTFQGRGNDQTDNKTITGGYVGGWGRDRRVRRGVGA